MIQKNLDKHRKCWHNVKQISFCLYNLIIKALNGNKVADVTDFRETAVGESRSGTAIRLTREPRF